MNFEPDRARELIFKRAKEAAGLEHDSELAKLMKVTPQTLSQWRSGQVTMTDERVIQMAEIAGDAPEVWLVLMSYANAKTAAAQKTWGMAALRVGMNLDDAIKKMGKKAAASAAALLVLLGATTLPGVGARDAQAAVQGGSGHENAAGLYIMRNYNYDDGGNSCNAPSVRDRVRID